MYQKKWLELCIQTYGHLFDENLNSGQDFELAFRVRELGAKFVFVPANPLHLRQVSPFTFQKIQFLRGYGIYCIWRCTRSKNLHPSQPSLLWDQSGSKGSSRWLLPVFTKKMLGPFDRSSFSNWNYFFQFWLGEKSQILGFLYGLLVGTGAGKKMVKSITP